MGVGLIALHTQRRTVAVASNSRRSGCGPDRQIGCRPRGFGASLTEWAYRRVDQRRIDGREVVVAQTHRCHLANITGFDNDIRTLGKFFQLGPVVLRTGEIEFDRCLTSPECREVQAVSAGFAASKRGNLAARRATNRLDRYHLGPKLSQHESSELTSPVGEIQYAIRLQHHSISPKRG